MEGSSLIMSVPNIITSSPSGGRFDFDDGGTYCGGWQDGKAHNHGVCTGPKNVGEYSGSWNFGFEISGVYKWTNGAVYEGRWQNGKRHGVGGEYNGKWVYKGEWSQGLKGRYGVKASSNSAVKYEGTWANGLQDGYGSETYSDGGYYQGQMCRGLRHGYGVRKSAPYGDSQLNNPNKNGPLIGGPSAMLIHSNSMQSTGSADLNLASGASAVNDEDDESSPKPEDGFKPNIDRTLVSKNGFVLVAKPLDVPLPAGSGRSGQLEPGRRRNSLANRLVSSAGRIPNQTTASILRGLRLRKQRSASDLEAIGATRGGGRAGGLANQLQQQDQDSPIVPFTLSPEELDITDASTVETYTGEWKQDKRNGHGVCDRSDGLKYEGQWHNDMKNGYGVTTFKDGSREEGKYKNNILTEDSRVKRFFQLGGSHTRQKVDEALKMAQQAQSMALRKAEIAETRAATARDKADQAMTAAIEADRDSQIAYSVARQYSDSQQQQQQFTFQQLQVSSVNLLPELGPPLGGLNMAASSLQARRISQHHQRANMFAAAGPNQLFGATGPTDLPTDHHHHHHHHHQQVAEPSSQDQRHQQQHFLGPGVEPFNGRRGSFRGGSHHLHQLQQAQQVGTPSNQRPPFGAHPQLSRQSSADPFSDLFDHYKPAGGHLFGGPAGRQRLLSKQTSLDHYGLRASLPRQLPGAGHHQDQADQASLSSSRLSSTRARSHFRAASLDQAEGEASRSQSPQDLREQQFRHLVTSGEELQQQQVAAASEGASSSQTNTMSSVNPGGQLLRAADDSTGGSPLAAAQFSRANSSFGAPSNQTPSPSELLSSLSGAGGQQRPGSQQHFYPPPNFRSNLKLQQQQRTILAGRQQPRDVHSLADEQLYLAGDRRRPHEQQVSEQQGEYSNYDFAISSGPRPSQRCMRRTASLSRAAPPPIRPKASILSADQLNSSTGALSALAQPSQRLQQRGRRQQRARSPSPALSAEPWPVQQLNFRAASVEPTRNASTSLDRQTAPAASQTAACSTPTTGPNWPNAAGNHLLPAADHLHHHQPAHLVRKPSLQVRYDPVQLGGLMSREEVAALSHAQREQKRIEAELAEKRAQSPLLHLYLSLTEFLSLHQLVISLLLFNLFIAKMFADLII